MYYLLNKNYELRGWTDQPYVLRNRTNGVTYILCEEEYHALLFCNGFTDSNNIMIAPLYRKLIADFISKGMVTLCHEKCSLEQYQKYYQYENRYLQAAHWSVTGKCNYKCRHCLISAPHAKLGEMNLEECYRVIDQLDSCGISAISITGGEALIRKDLLQIVDRLLEKNISICSLYTNGRLLDEQILEEFQKRTLYPEISISFDGVGFHDWLRGVEGAEEEAIRAFELCRKKGFITTSEMCLHKYNKNSLRETVNLLAKLGVKSLKIDSVIDSGEWKNETGCKLTMEELFDVFLDYIAHYIEDGCPMSINLGGIFASTGKGSYTIPLIKFANDNNLSEVCLCGHAKYTMYIGPDGTILPCMPMAGSCIQHRFPNILQEPLKDILNDSFYRSVLDIHLDNYLENRQECSQCEFKFECGGGCRGRAMKEECDDYFLIDEETCYFFKHGYIDRIKKITNDHLVYLK